MNVGSILNNDTPPSDHETEVQQQLHHQDQLKQERLTETSLAGKPDIVSLTNPQRHSITSILNEPTPTPTSKSVPTLAPIPAAVESTIPGPVPALEPAPIISPVVPTARTSKVDEFPKPISVNSNSTNTVPHSINGHSTTTSSTTSSPYASKRNSIANITNDRDVDITTGKETTVNVSRNSSLSDSPKVTPKQYHEVKREVVQPEPVSTEANLSVDVNDELSKLKAIKRSTKPRRYNTPPIWAQRYVPPNRRYNNNNNHHNDLHNSDIQSNGNGNVKYKINDTPVFNYTTTASIDLQVSITGVIPPSSFTRTVAEWIYANFSNISEENRKYVELELKFGKIMDKRTGNRINVDVVTECIYTNQSSTFFEMQVEEIAWKEIKKFFEELEKNYQDELRTGVPDALKPRRKFNMLDSDITDTFYQVGNRGEQIKRVRISKDNSLTPPRYTAIEKKRIADLFIHNPSSMYDLRLSLALEMPVPENNIEPIMSKNKPAAIREKKRNTWTHAPTLTQFDLTRVLVPREAKNKHGKTIINHDVNYEVELEIDTLEVFNAIDKIVAGTDAYRLEELVEIYINNARILNNRITKLASP